MTTLMKYLSVYLLSAVRFFLGPTAGISYELGILITSILTIFGMMTTVYLIIYFGVPIRSFFIKWMFKKQRVFTSRNRKFVKIWKKYGLIGVAMVTPIILSPPVGAMLCNIVGGKRSEIIKWMWISAIFWAFFESTLIFYTGKFVFNFF